MKPNILFCIATYFLTATNSYFAMEPHTITKPEWIGFMNNNTIVVGGKDGCKIFDSKSQKILHQLTSKTITHLVVNNKMIVCVGDKRLLFFNAKAEIIHPQRDIWQNTNLALSPIDDTLFFYHQARLGLYDSLTGQRIFWKKEIPNRDPVPYSTSATACPLIACHPTKNIILYPSNKQTLLMVQPGSNPLVSMNLNTNTKLCGGGEYSADGSAIAFNDQSQDKYFIYYLPNKNELAYELAADNKKYISVAFHPNKSLLALLSQDNIIQYWDYVSRILIATTHPLTSNIGNSINSQTKRLTFSPDGTKLAIVLRHIWRVVEVPEHYNNIVAIPWYLQKIYNLPKELIQIIIHKIIYNSMLSKINCTGLSKLQKLTIPQQETDIQTDTEHRNIKIIYCDK